MRSGSDTEGGASRCFVAAQRSGTTHSLCSPDLEKTPARRHALPPTWVGTAEPPSPATPEKRHQETGRGACVFSCFNSESSAAGTALSEKDEGDQSECPSHLPPSRAPEFVKGMAECECALCLGCTVPQVREGIMRSLGKGPSVDLCPEPCPFLPLPKAVSSLCGSRLAERAATGKVFSEERSHPLGRQAVNSAWPALCAESGPTLIPA